MLTHLIKLRDVARARCLPLPPPDGGRLYKIDEVEEYQRSNPYIRSGYRHRLSALACLSSTFSLHNETVNIWTHLLGFVFFAGLLVRDLLLVLPSHLQLLEKIAVADLLVLVGVLVCYQACMILSSLFHTFTCHSQRVSERCLSLDLVGITLALLATYLSGIYYAFWCQPGWRDFHLTMVGGIFLTAAAMQLSPKFAVEEYFHIRLGLFCLWAAYGVIPTIHWIELHGGISSSVVRLLLPRIFVMYGICGIALVFYLTKLPERILPGSLDIIGHSHQWWHVLIFLALLFWHQTGVNFALFRLSTGCSNAPLSQETIKELSLWPF